MRLAKRVRSIAIVLAVLAIVFAGWWFLIWPARNFDRLLQGDQTVEIVSASISGQNLSIELSDPESISYLTQALRSASNQANVPLYAGSTYNVQLWLRSGGFVNVAFYIPSNLDGLTLAYPLDSMEDPTYYWVSFSKPMPNGIVEAIERMRNPRS